MSEHSITVNAKHFLRAYDAVRGIVNRKGTIPALARVILDVQDRVSLHAFNESLTVHAEATVPPEGLPYSLPLRALLPQNGLEKHLRGVKGTITISLDEYGVPVFESENASWKSGEAFFDTMPQFDIALGDVHRRSIIPERFAHWLPLVADALGDDFLRPAIAHALLDADGTLVGADGFRMAISPPVTAEVTTYPVLFPKDALAVIGKAMKEKVFAVGLDTYTNGGHELSVLTEGINVHVQWKHPEHIYLDYKRLDPFLSGEGDDWPLRFATTGETFADIGKQQENVVLEWSDDSLRVTAGEWRGTYEAGTHAPGPRVMLDPAFLKPLGRKGLSPCISMFSRLLSATAQVVFEVDAPDDLGSAHYVVMPIFFNEGV